MFEICWKKYRIFRASSDCLEERGEEGSEIRERIFTNVSKDSLNAFPIVLLPNDRCLESVYCILRNKKVRQGSNKINKR